MLQWLTGSIGFHHVHHLAPRIPNYRLEACHNAHPAFGTARVLGIREGLRASRYALWDEAEDRMATFAEIDRTARAAAAAAFATEERRSVSVRQPSRSPDQGRRLPQGGPKPTVA